MICISVLTNKFATFTKTSFVEQVQTDRDIQGTRVPLIQSTRNKSDAISFENCTFTLYLHRNV